MKPVKTDSTHNILKSCLLASMLLNLYEFPYIHPKGVIMFMFILKYGVGNTRKKHLALSLAFRQWTLNYSEPKIRILLSFCLTSVWVSEEDGTRNRYLRWSANSHLCSSFLFSVSHTDGSIRGNNKESQFWSRKEEGTRRKLGWSV